MTTLETLLKGNPDSEIIDLVSHSHPDNLLVMGTFEIAAGSFSDAHNDLIEHLEGKKLFLVGCSTLIGDLAHKALLHLESKLRVHAYGAYGLIGTGDLTPDGLDPNERPRLFSRPDAKPGEYEITEEDLTRHRPRTDLNNKSRNKILSDLLGGFTASVKQLFRILSPQSYYDYPGLLQKPMRSVPSLPSQPGQNGGRLDVLLSGQLVRLTRLSTQNDVSREYLFKIPSEFRVELQKFVDHLLAT